MEPNVTQITDKSVNTNIIANSPVSQLNQEAVMIAFNKQKYSNWISEFLTNKKEHRIKAVRKLLIPQLGAEPSDSFLGCLMCEDSRAKLSGEQVLAFILEAKNYDPDFNISKFYDIKPEYRQVRGDKWRQLRFLLEAS